MAIGASQSRLSDWERGRWQPKSVNLQKIAATLSERLDRRLTVDDLLNEGRAYDLTGHGSTEPSVLREGERVEEFDVRDGYQPDDLPVITEGEGSPRPEIFWDTAGQLLSTVTERISRPAGLKDRRAYGVKVKGDSMVPAIRPGHYLVVSPAAPIADGDEVFVVLKSGAHLIKFAKKIDGGWLLESANQLHESRIVKKSEIESIHAIVWIRRKRPGLRTIDEATGRQLPSALGAERLPESTSVDDIRKRADQLTPEKREKFEAFLDELLRERPAAAKAAAGKRKVR